MKYTLAIAALLMSSTYVMAAGDVEGEDTGAGENSGDAVEDDSGAGAGEDSGAEVVDGDGGKVETDGAKAAA